MRTRIGFVGACALLLACGGRAPDVEGDGLDTGEPDTSAVETPEGFGWKEPAFRPGPPTLPLTVEPPAPRSAACPAIYSDGMLQRFDIEISEADWASLKNEHDHYEALKDAGIAVENYYPLAKFSHAGKVATDAMIRLRGNPNAWHKQEKMQFQISFKEKNPDGRFRGLRKLVLDSAHYNASYLRDRLAMSIIRDAGLPAPCVNHAVLYVNGEYYGLFANIEKVDREFLERNFDQPDGNLYKKGRILKTNEDENPDTSRVDAFWRADTTAEMERMADVQQFAEVLAAEAVFPDADGYWAGGWNFYFYDHPTRGFLYLPWDIDLAFDNLPADTDPLTWHKTNDNFHGRPHVDAIFADPVWRNRFVEAVAKIRAVSDPEVMEARIRGWAAQIHQAAFDDPYKPWTNDYHLYSVERLIKHVRARAEFLDAWTACWRDHAEDPSFAGPCP